MDLTEDIVNVKIEGVSPLLFNRFIDAEISSAVKKRSGATHKADPADKLYIVDGKIYTPATHIYGSIVNAGKNFKIQGKQRSTYSKLLGSSIEVNPEAIVHKFQDWEVFECSAVNPNTKGRVISRRPMMRKWALDFTISYNADDIPKEVLKGILDYAGRYVGIGDWRPDKKGKYGKFIVNKFD